MVRCREKRKRPNNGDEATLLAGLKLKDVLPALQGVMHDNKQRHGRQSEVQWPMILGTNAGGRDFGVSFRPIPNQLDRE